MILVISGKFRTLHAFIVLKCQEKCADEVVMALFDCVGNQSNNYYKSVIVP